MALIDQGDFTSAELEFSTALQSEPGNARVFDRLGRVLATQNRMDEAAVRFLESTRLDPKYAGVHLHYAMSLSAHRQPHEAIAEYGRALALDDRLASAYNDLAWMLAANSDTQIRNGQEAVKLAERACRLTNDEQPFYLVTMAAAYAEAGDFKNAIIAAEKARDIARKAGLETL